MLVLDTLTAVDSSSLHTGAHAVDSALLPSRASIQLTFSQSLRSRICRLELTFSQSVDSTDLFATKASIQLTFLAAPP
jgi:hypothetical protein